MKILHISIASSFTEGMMYQENLHVEEMCKQGHKVTLVADCHKYEKGVIVETNEEDKIIDCGARLIRKKYVNIFGKFISSKLRALKHLLEIIEEVKPDIIFHHGLQSYEMLTVSKYKKENPSVKFYVDSHEDFNNSARSWISRNILHKTYYKYIIEKSLPYIDKVFCVAYESFGFLDQMYRVHKSKMEFFPLGGFVYDEKTRIEKRNNKRKELALNEDDVLLIHSGKFDKLKRTDIVLKALKRVDSKSLKLDLIVPLASIMLVTSLVTYGISLAERSLSTASFVLS